MTTIVKVDEKGRIVIPKSIRERTEMKEGRYVKVTAKEKSIIVEPIEPAADRYFGPFKIAKWPKDLDDFVIEVYHHQRRGEAVKKPLLRSSLMQLQWIRR